MKLLQEDPTETARDILYTISQQLANNSIPPFPQTKYETPQYAITVNGLLFTSLSCSLIAALLAVLALQWVANYDMGLSTSSARKRALQRHTRWKGIEKWKMGEIIASLPLLIFVSLFLFFIGIADWLWHLNQAIASIVIAGIGIGCLVYSVTNIISIVKLEAPFRTPVSKGLAPLFRRALALMRFLVLAFPSEAFTRNEVSPKVLWSRVREIWNGAYNCTTVPPQNFAKCEELSVEGKEETALESLIWLANSIEISTTSRDLFLALTKEIIRLPAELLLREEKMDQAPWESIFIELCNPYFGKRSIQEYSEEDAKTVRHICKAFSMIPSKIVSPALSTFFYSLEGTDVSTDLAIDLSQYRHLNGGPRSLRSALDRIHTSISPVENNTLHFLFLTIQKAWPSIGKNYIQVLGGLTGVCNARCSKTGDPYPIPIKSLLVILDLIACRDESRFNSINASQQHTIIDRYICAVQRMKEGEEKTDNCLAMLIHISIKRQILAHMSTIDFSLPSAINDLAGSMEMVSKLTSSNFLALANEQRHQFIHILTKIYAENSDKTIKNMVEESLLNGLQYNYGRNHQPISRWTSLILAVDEYLKSGGVQSQEDHPEIIHIICRNPPAPSHYNPESFLQKTLINIKDPSIALWLMEYCPRDWRFEALLRPNFRKWSDSTTDAVASMLKARLHLIHSNLGITFLRAMIIDGPPCSRGVAIDFLQSNHAIKSEKVIDFICISPNHLNNLFTRIGRKYLQRQF
jgi:hypothetical protein